MGFVLFGVCICVCVCIYQRVGRGGFSLTSYYLCLFSPEGSFKAVFLNSKLVQFVLPEPFVRNNIFLVSHFLKVVSYPSFPTHCSGRGDDSVGVWSFSCVLQGCGLYS